MDYPLWACIMRLSSLRLISVSIRKHKGKWVSKRQRFPVAIERYSIYSATFKENKLGSQVERK